MDRKLSVAGESNLAGAQATYSAIFQEFFGDGVPGVSQMFSFEQPINGTSLRVPMVTSFPRVRRWLGDKVAKSLRAFVQTFTLEPWEQSIEMDRITVDYDADGVVDMALRQFLGGQVQMFDDMNITELLTNPTGYDATALLADSHPYSNSTGDNLTTDALSLSSLRAMDLAMRGFQNEDGKPLLVTPSHLLVGESLKDTALEITGADRPIYFDASGAEATSSVVGGVVIENVRRGTWTPIVTPWITGTQWFLMDLTKPGLRPWIVARGRAFTPVTQLSEDSDPRYRRGVYGFSVEGDYGIGAGLWPLIGGKIAA